MDELTVARIGRPHGLAGEFLVRSETDDGPDVFVPGRRFLLRFAGQKFPDETLTLEASRPHKGGFLLKFVGVSDVDGARRLIGGELALAPDELRPLDEGEFFLHELVGLDVVEVGGDRLGTIADVYDAAGQLLAALDIEGRQRLFPVRREIVRKIDMEAGTMEVSLPVGLLEL